MAFRNPVLDVEPYQESQVTAPPAPASPDELKAFYSDMERQDLQRKLSRSKTGSRSLWSRKSLKKSLSVDSKVPQDARPPAVQPAQQQPQPQKEKEMDLETAKGGDAGEKANHVGPLAMPSRSIIPDSLSGSPLWHIKEIHGSVPLPVHRGRYPLHNPFGPRWYKNHHLIPPAQLRPTIQSLSFFSTSFPSIPPSSHERQEDPPKGPGPSKTPSNPPQSTSASSQTGIADNGRTRSRKTSQTAPDTVDLLDVTDPWGTNWHHQSPYDVGLNNDPEPDTRPRVMPAGAAGAGAGAQALHKTSSPSPLSQSTSVLHLQPNDSQDPHKLSKRRRPVLQNSLRIPGKDSNNTTPQTMSLPTTPNRTPSPSKPDDPRGRSFLGRPYSALPGVTRRTERRTSLIGRLAKKFSLLRKPTRNQDEDWHHVDINETKRSQVVHSKHSSMAAMQTKATEPVADTARPWSLVSLTPSHDHKPASSVVPNTQVLQRSSSPVSLDAPVSLGRLTIANPDAPPLKETVAAPSSGAKVNIKPEIPVPPKDEPSRVVHAPRPGRSSPRKLDGSTSLPPPSEYPLSPFSAPTIPSEIDLHSTHSPTKTAESSHFPSGTDQAKPHQLAESRIPFPVSMNDSLPEIPSLLSPPPRVIPFPSLGTDSPLSTSSMLVNPPTPHVPEVAMPRTEPGTSTRPLEIIKRSSQDRQGNGVTRQTETFRLVRSSSGAISAAGQQWEVVESESPRRSKTRERSSKSNDRESGSRKEHRRQDKSRAEPNEASSSRQKTGQTRQRSANGRVADSSSTRTSSTPGRPRTHSSDARAGRGRHSGSESVSNEEQKSSQRRDSEEERASDRKRQSVEARQNGVNIDKPQPLLPPPTPDGALVERRPSLTARPISELPSSAELSAMRARDVWDMERLWKGRSMYETDPADIPSAPETVRASTASHASANRRSREEPVMSSVHGSSHTSYVVHPSYQSGQTSYTNIYHSMPVAPPPIVYSSPPLAHPSLQYQTFYVQPSPPSFSLPSPDVSAMSSSSSSSLRAPLSNPLPAPPRESSYTPTPINSVLSDPNARSADYWTKYAGVQAAH